MKRTTPTLTVSCVNTQSVVLMALVSSFCAKLVLAEDHNNADAPHVIIQDQGYLLLKDTESFYYFYADGRFLSGPHGWCGRTIRGRFWMTNSIVTISGKWSAVNQPWITNDYREVTVHLKVGQTAGAVPYDIKSLAISRPYPHAQNEWPFPSSPVCHTNIYMTIKVGDGWKGK